MAIWMAGIDHNRATLDQRSVFSFTNKKSEQAYAHFRENPEIGGCVIISTCNRMEFWLSAPEDLSAPPLALLCSFLGIDAAQYAPCFVQRQGRGAVDHLFRLAAGMESKIIGEDQIITQVGDALALARKNYATDHALEVLFRLAVTAGKRVKTDVTLTTADRSVIHTALRMLEEKGVSVAGRRTMVIGNGMMGKLSAEALMERGADVTVTVRQYRSGIVDIPFGCKRIAYDERLSLLPECDLVVSATSSPNFTLEARRLAPLTVRHPVIFIDLAVPRDIETGVGELPWATLYDIDDFHIDLRSSQLTAALEQAQAILDEEEAHFYDWYEGRDVAERICRLRRSAGADVGARVRPALRRTFADEPERSAWRSEISGAGERMMNHLLFGLRARLSDAAFRDCLDAMEQVLSEQKSEKTN
ncbi:MAG: glutamyl-tRNA reductase [Ruminococcaceae bacterium]|nr:glutamyl-tRNA reductase [Oscillospiraceae bacterium]